MDPVRKAELRAELEELKAELKQLKEKRSLPGAKVMDDKFAKFLVEESKKQIAALREEYSNREPLILDLGLKSQQDPCCTAASPPGVAMLPGSTKGTEDGVNEGLQELHLCDKNEE